MKPHSVVIVEDHILLSQAIESLLHTFEDYKVLYTCINGQDFIDKLEDGFGIPDIVLMDVNMPVLNGIETTKIITQNYPNIKVIALSVEENENTVTNMLKAGACSYLVKDVEKCVFENALNEVALNGYYHTRKVSKILQNLIKPNLDRKKTELKERELEFIKYACTEMTYKEIADKMYLSPKTIDGYRSNLFQKLHAKNRIGLVLYAIKNKIFSP